MGTEKPMVKIEHLYKEFDSDTKVLKDINLTINKNGNYSAPHLEYIDFWAKRRK